MSKSNVGIRELISELNIGKKEIEFSNDLNLFLDVVAFDDSDCSYYEIIKKEFDNYMGRWDIDLDTKFFIISQYIKSKKLPYKILKDEGFESIKSDKFILSMLVEVYALNIVINCDDISKSRLIKYIHTQLNANGLNIEKKFVILNDLDYLFRSKKIGLLCKDRLIKNKDMLKKSLEKIKREVEARKNLSLNLSTDIEVFNEISDKKELEENVNIKNGTYSESIDNKILNEYKEKEFYLKSEIEKLQRENMELIEYGNEQYSKALVDLVRYMNDDINGNLLDRLYCYLKGNDEVNIRFIVSNIFNVLKQKGIFPRETLKLGDRVEVEEYSFYNYRLNKDISDVKLCDGEVLYPAWFYKDKEIIKPYVNIKGEK